MKKITEMIIKALLNKGVAYQSDSCDITIDVPAETIGMKGTDKVTIRIEAENIKITLQK